MDPPGKSWIELLDLRLSKGHLAKELLDLIVFEVERAIGGDLEFVQNLVQAVFVQSFCKVVSLLLKGYCSRVETAGEARPKAV